MKNTRKLIPAVAMLLVSAIMMSTASFAWFSMNTQVTATGMKVKAQAEGGIVISNESKGQWAATAEASNSSVAEIIPTSTKDLDTWFHAVSTDAANAAAGQDADKYTTLTENVTAGVATADIGSENKAIYLVNKFYIKSSSAAMTLTGSDYLMIKNVSVTGAADSTELDKSLRVGIKIGGKVYIFAPVTGGLTSYKVGGATDTASTGTTTANAAGTTDINTTVQTIPVNTTTTPTEASIFVYFEGEDTSCKSDNITATLDTLSVDVAFAIPN